MRKAQQNNNKKRFVIIIAAIIAAAAAVCAIVFFMMQGQKNTFAFDELAQNGFLEGRTQEDIQRLVNQQVEEGMFNVSINSVITYENGGAEGSVCIENIPANRYHMKVRFLLDETGEVVYESAGIKPGQFIEKAPLSKPLEKGSYATTAVFSAIDQETLKEIGRTNVEITLEVLN